MASRKTGDSAPGGATRSPRAATARRVATAPLPTSMVTGKASTAKAAVGDAPALAYIASLPQPQRGIAERIDRLAAATLPGLEAWPITASATAGVSVAADSTAT